MTCNYHHETSHPVATCAWCQKGAYVSRRGAKRASRRHHPGRNFCAYPCPVQATWWHYGTLPPGGRTQAQRSQGFKLAQWRQ